MELIEIYSKILFSSQQSHCFQVHFGHSYGVSLFLHSEGRQLHRGHLDSIGNQKILFLIYLHFVCSFENEYVLNPFFTHFFRKTIQHQTFAEIMKN